MAINYSGLASPTLCWKCANACGGCSWSIDFTPVEGWKAKPTKLKKYNGEFTESYIVFDCPEFVEEE